jgi:hypothetical protein
VLLQVALQYCAIVVDKAAAHETFHSDFGKLSEPQSTRPASGSHFNLSQAT